LLIIPSHSFNLGGKEEEDEEKGTQNLNEAVSVKGEPAVSVATSERGGVQLFTYKQLHAATGGFGKGHVVGQGSFGSVYRGVLSDGGKIAVKLMDRPGKQGEDEFKMEVCLFQQLCFDVVSSTTYIKQ
jgi:hypothetical protein